MTALDRILRLDAESELRTAVDALDQTVRGYARGVHVDEGTNAGLKPLIQPLFDSLFTTWSWTFLGDPSDHECPRRNGLQRSVVTLGEKARRADADEPQVMERLLREFLNEAREFYRGR